ncbi:MAG: hypothetical protein H7Z17_05435 [Fuerstia sp.]|nr:hypothetical protein [Fuerstiella sp.]
MAAAKRFFHRWWHEDPSEQHAGSSIGLSPSDGRSILVIIRPISVVVLRAEFSMPQSPSHPIRSSSIMHQSHEKTSNQVSTNIPGTTITIAQKVFAEVVGRELARQWIEQQTLALSEGERPMEARLDPQNLAHESSPSQP